MALVDGFLELERSSGKLEWSAILQKMASDLGFSKILFGLLPKDSQDYENAFIVGNYPAAWREHYDRAGYARVDPPVSHCTQSVLPIFWEPSIYQTRKQHEFFEEASAAGLVYGLTMPLHGARGELGALSLSVEAENRAEANRFMESVLPTLWMLKDYALQSGAGLAFEHPVSKPVVLTSREKEVLQWCAIGKTSWEISVICNCSEANVNFHMGNIRRKFGVTSRRVAAIMAVNLGLITL
ncbi:TPA: transcriptional regulator LasR [Pseudomonas aeruginosa]